MQETEECDWTKKAEMGSKEVTNEESIDSTENLDAAPNYLFW